jgi:hypothetical protein
MSPKLFHFIIEDNLVDKPQDILIQDNNKINICTRQTDRQTGRQRERERDRVDLEP